MTWLCILAQVYGSWPQWGAEPRHTSLQLMKGAMDTPTVKWSYRAAGEIDRQGAAIADVNGNGLAEVVMASEDSVLCLSGSDGTLLWSFEAEGDWAFFPSLGVADVNNDGVMEVLITALHPNLLPDTGLLYCISGIDGSLIWSARVDTCGLEHAPVIADLDGDGVLEVAVGSWQDGSVFVFSGDDGHLEWDFDPYDGGHSVSTGPTDAPTAADVDGDGQVELLIDVNSDNSLYCLSGVDGSVEWAFDLGEFPWSTSAVADLDGDGTLEVVVGTSTLYCLSGVDGSVRWSTTLGGKVRSAPVLGDANEDGVLDVFVGASDSTVYCISGVNGSVLWSKALPSDFSCPGSLADIDGDNKLEYLATQWTNDTLFCLNAENGSVEWFVALSDSFPHAYDVHTSLIGDLDGDGCSEIVLGTAGDTSGFGYVVALDDPHGASDCGALGASESQTGSGLGLFVHPAKGVFVRLPREAWVKLEAYDAAGRLASTLFKGFMSPGIHLISAAKLKRGVYMLILRTADGTAKATLVK